MPDLVEALRGVVIEQGEAAGVLQAFDGPETLHYVDPPYLLHTRNTAHPGYRHELGDAEHEELLAALRSLRGMVVLSGYPSDLYRRELLEVDDPWHTVELAAQVSGGKRVTELLWFNAAAWARRPQASLLDEAVP